MYQYGSRKKSKSFYIFGYLLELIVKNLAIGRIFFVKSDKFGPFFSLKILPIGSNHIFEAGIW